jgi:hypothetical protein
MILIAETPPILNISSNVIIVSPVNNANRNYLLPVGINGSTLSSVLVTIYTNSSTRNMTMNSSSIIITIPMPNNTNSFVEVS